MAYIYPTQNSKFRVYYLYKTKKIYLGLYNNSESASLAYDFVQQIFEGDLTVDAYTVDIPISFDKFISCINFRDSNFYFKTPIYVYKDCFKYYLKPDLVLTFDLKDLLFFSNTRIHKRRDYLYTYMGDHQENILRRFGFTKSMIYLKDYRFKNGDRYDFRRENIEVINHYYGVKKEKRYNQPTYVARIALQNTSLTIGHYETEIQAAIAYNKAADLVNYRLEDSPYPLNSFPFLTRQEYQDLYDELVISKRLTHRSTQNRVCSSKKWRGVSKDQSSYRAIIGYNKKRIYLGNYPTEKRAAQAYNYASLYLYGPNGYTNEIDPLVYSNDALAIAKKLEKAGVLKQFSSIVEDSLEYASTKIIEL